MEWSRSDCTSANVPRYQRYIHEVPDPGEQAPEGSAPGSSTSWPLLEYIGEEPSSPDIPFDTPKDTWNIYTPTVGDVVPLPLRQPVVVQQTPQVPEVMIAPATGENTSADVPINEKYGECIDIPNQLLPPGLASAPPTYLQDPVSPVTFFCLREGAQRMLHSPTEIFEDSSASTNFHQQLLYLGQARSFHDSAINYFNPNPPASLGHGGHEYMNPLSQYRLPDARNNSNTHEVPSQTSQAVGDDLPERSGSSHIALSSDNTSGGYRQLVGSPAITQASTARRRDGARQTRLYFCEVPGCTSRGFTARHNLRCEPVILLTATVLLTVIC
ncbi:hypothetical protein PQX77_016422 [Marasmius sp. AFHP31]|nr:hypothetical protein PQX77_016422 [Marasmius sp. AFHP31]